MNLPSFATRSAIGLASPFVGRKFVTAFDALQESERLDPAALIRRSEGKLAPLLRHALANVPFYREYARSAGFSAGTLTGSTSDLRRLPVITKSVIREHGLAHFTAQNLPAYRGVPNVTSGSTGEPFEFLADREAAPYIYASHLVLDRWAGFQPLDRYLRLVGPKLRRPASTAPLRARIRSRVRAVAQDLYERLTQRRLSVMALPELSPEEIQKAVESFRPDYIMGYTSSLAWMAEKLLHAGLPVTPVKAVVTIAEAVTPERQNLIEQCFQAPIVNRYGQREFGFWAGQNCSATIHRFHILTDLVIPEVVREDGSPAQPGEVGRLILTNLTNEVMPLLRYDSGDLAAMGTETCECGRTLPYIAKLVGRSKECLVAPSGTVLSPAVLGNHLFVVHGFTPAVRHFQLVQESQTSAVLLVVPGASYNERAAEELCKALIELTGPGMTVRVAAVDEIAVEQSGKRPIIKLCNFTTT